MISVVYLSSYLFFHTIKETQKERTLENQQFQREIQKLRFDLNAKVETLLKIELELEKTEGSIRSQNSTISINFEKLESLKESIQKLDKDSK